MAARKKAVAKGAEPSARVQALRRILALRVKREPVPAELEIQDDMRFTSRRRVHAVLQAMQTANAGMEEVDRFVAREIRE